MRKLRSGSANLIENMVVSFFRSLEHHSRLFQQISPHRSSADVELLVELQLDELPEPGTVVIPRRFCISNRLQQKKSLTPFCMEDLNDLLSQHTK